VIERENDIDAFRAMTDRGEKGGQAQCRIGIRGEAFQFIDDDDHALPLRHQVEQRGESVVRILQIKTQHRLHELRDASWVCCGSGGVLKKSIAPERGFAQR
jgi:hypothetical protein